MTVALYYSLKSGRLTPPVPFFFLKITLAIRRFLYFHTNCELICSSSVKNTIGSLIGIAWNLQIALGRQYTHFHYTDSSDPRTWCISPSICIIFDFLYQCFIVVYIQVFLSLGRFIPKYWRRTIHLQGDAKRNHNPQNS